MLTENKKIVDKIYQKVLTRYMWVRIIILVNDKSYQKTSENSCSYKPLVSLKSFAIEKGARNGKYHLLEWHR